MKWNDSLVRIMTLLALSAFPAALLAQQGVPWSPLKRGSDNVEVVGHLPLGGFSMADVEVEQELDRPYAYVARKFRTEPGARGLDIISIADPERPEVLYRWRIENQDLHLGAGGYDVKHFKWNNRYYVVQSLQFGVGGPDLDLGAVVLDVTGLPDPGAVREVARIREPELPGGFHNIFIYKHSDGRVLLLATVSGPFAHVYDLGRVVEGNLENALVGRIPVPESAVGSGGRRGYHDFYVGFHPETGTDRFYGGGTGGYYVYDITDLENPDLLVTLTGISGITRGHTFTPTSDGRYAIAESEYQYAPLRIFDLKPALDRRAETGQPQNVRRPISGWTADWKQLTHNHEVRWPFVFVSGYLDGLQIFSLMDPENPVTVGYYDTYLGSMKSNDQSVTRGAFGVDVRNADGLIVVSDMNTGLWIFRMDGFNGWNGEWWGVPDVSSAQKWDTPLKRRPISDR